VTAKRERGKRLSTFLANEMMPIHTRVRATRERESAGVEEEREGGGKS
jgi:hypothetical protein